MEGKGAADGDGREEDEYVPVLFELVAGRSGDDDCDDGVGMTAAAAQAPTSALGLAAAAAGTANGAGMAPPTRARGGESVRDEQRWVLSP